MSYLVEGRGEEGFVVWYPVRDKYVVLLITHDTAYEILGDPIRRSEKSQRVRSPSHHDENSQY